jgi:DNA polymerase III delta prime subunit
MQAIIFQGEAAGAAALAYANGLNGASNPDTVIIRGTGKNSIGVDDVREQVIAPAATEPFVGPYKIFIVENAHTLTPQAQHALLKTIEEPAAYAVFLLPAPHVYNFLPTVISRCSVRKAHGKLEVPSGDALAKEIATADMFAIFAMAKRLADMEKPELGAVLDGLYIATARADFRAAGAIQNAKKQLSQNASTLLVLENMLLETRDFPC